MIYVECYEKRFGHRKTVGHQYCLKEDIRLFMPVSESSFLRVSLKYLKDVPMPSQETLNCQQSQSKSSTRGCSDEHAVMCVVSLSLDSESKQAPIRERYWIRQGRAMSKQNKCKSLNI